MSMSELRLQAPLWFDESIGYWTGEADLAALRRALLAVPPEPGVERAVSGGAVLLRGPEQAVLREAVRLREAGLL